MSKGIRHIGGWLAGHPRTFAFALYLGAALLLFGRPVLDDPGGECICLGSSPDPGLFMWALEWWPKALGHGHNPFVSDAIFVPQGGDVAKATLIPGAALAVWPVTALAGPVVAYNLLALASPVLAAFFCFLLCRRLVRGALAPALAGGWLFGFSTYLLGQLTGHLNLTLVFLVPAIAHLTLRRAAGELGTRAYVGLAAAAFVGQVLLSTEVALTLGLMGVVTLAAVCALGPADVRARVRALVPEIGIATALAALVASPYLYYSLKGGGPPVFAGRAEKYSNDLLAFFFPTEITRLGRRNFLELGLRYPAGFVEGGAYLGLPLLAALVAFAARTWRHWGTRVLVVVAAVAAVGSLGSRLHVAGTITVPLPWKAIGGLPLVEALLPARLALYVFLAASAAMALWLADTRGRRGLRWTLYALAALALLPNLAGNYWHGRPSVPPLFAGDGWKRHIHADEAVLALPTGIGGNAMMWQARARLGFRLAGGYLGEEIPTAYRNDPLLDSLRYFAQPPGGAPAVARFLQAHQVDVVAFDEHNLGPWPAVLQQLGYAPVRAGGAVLYRITRVSHPR